AQRGETYRLIGHLEEAVADLNRAVEMDPSFSWAYASRAQALIALERRDAALADLNRALELNRDLGWAWAERGRLLMVLLQHEHAAEDCTLATIPDAKRVRELEQYEQAAQDFTQAIERQFRLGWVYAERGKA